MISNPGDKSVVEGSERLIEQYQRVRETSVGLCEPLAVDDYGTQPMPDASPPKWHLAHVTWFFETFLLSPSLPGYSVFNAQFEVLFNSYYNGVGEQFPRDRRGHLSRPTVAEVLAYREHVDAGMASFLAMDQDEATLFRVVLGLHHEQQHQELILTDLKYNLGNNPLHPRYVESSARESGGLDAPALRFIPFAGGVNEVGWDGRGFCFDNETPRHAELLVDYSIANRPVTNGEYTQFIDDGGYDEPDLWLSDGWRWNRESGVRAPLYWRDEEGEAREYHLGGIGPRCASQPVCHVSFYEAWAYARWSGARLPTEAEWEHASMSSETAGNYAGSAAFQPLPAEQDGRGHLLQMFGDVWEWTASSYGPYPGFREFGGALGEYNGKFMANQLVLRGGSCATPDGHMRHSYRNFFYPADRWQFSGIRLAK